MAIIGELSIEMSDGTVLTDRTDIGLAGQWAAHEYGPEKWAALTFGEKSRATAEALFALREAAESP